MMAGKNELSTVTVRPFVPGGRDFEQSKRFYQALGFAMTFDNGQVAGFASDTGGFILQNFYDEGWAGNFMMQMIVHDLDAWWTHIQSLDLARTFGVREPNPPAMRPWGLREAHLIGPSGELWHVVQKQEG